MTLSTHQIFQFSFDDRRVTLWFFRFLCRFFFLLLSLRCFVACCFLLIGCRDVVCNVLDFLRFFIFVFRLLLSLKRFRNDFCNEQSNEKAIMSSKVR